MSWQILQGDCLAVLKTLPSESVQCSHAYPVEFVSEHTQALHCSRHLDRAMCGTGMAALLGYSEFLASLFEFSQFDAVFGLTCLDAQKWSHGTKERRGFHISYLPSLKRFTVLGARVSAESVSAEQLEEQVNRSGFHLLNADALRVNRLSAITNNTHGIGGLFNTNASIGINHSSAISEG